MPSYIKATRPVLEIFKIVFPDSPHTSSVQQANTLKVQHQLKTQYFKIYYTQPLHILAIYPYHLWAG